MGYWGSGLYANDTGMDVRDTYMDLLQDGMDDETAWNTMLKKFSEYINTDEEALFWYAAADTQWRLGRLRPEVRDKAGSKPCRRLKSACNRPCPHTRR